MHGRGRLRNVTLKAATIHTGDGIAGKQLCPSSLTRMTRKPPAESATSFQSACHFLAHFNNSGIPHRPVHKGSY